MTNSHQTHKQPKCHNNKPKTAISQNNHKQNHQTYRIISPNNIHNKQPQFHHPLQVGSISCMLFWPFTKHPMSSPIVFDNCCHETLRRGKAQIIYKKYQKMDMHGGPLQNTKPSTPNIQNHLYKIEVHPSYSHQNMTQQYQKMPLQNHFRAKWGLSKCIFILFYDAQTSIL